MKIYTKTGDKGKTSLIGGSRVSKDHIRIEAFGTIDELNANIGLINSQNTEEKLTIILTKIQNDLFTIGTMLATPSKKELLKPNKQKVNIASIDLKSIEFLEKEIDEMNKNLSIMKNFILPGGNTIVSFCHITRCVCRRAERIIVHLNDKNLINPLILKYLNRLSDYLFVLARKLTKDNKSEENLWIPEHK